MVKPIKQFEISSLKVSGFKCFAEERSFSFGPMNAIFGHNAQGKSTIADAISYAITGVSFFGSNRMDRLRAPGKNISVELQIVDGEGQPHCLIRNRVGDNTDVFWDGQPIAAKDLNTVFAERDLFLAVFNPLYLIEVLGNKGRDLFERYMPEVPHEKVMEQLSEHNQSILAQNPFLSPEALVKQTRESIRELESTLTYCQGQQDLLRSQREQSGVLLADRQKELQDCRVRIQELESIRTTGFDGSDLKERLADLYSLHEEYVREQASLPQTDDLDAKFRDLTQKRAKREADVYHSQYQKSTLSDLYRLLETYTLDPVFERYGEFVNRTPCWIDGETARKYSGASVIAGNFLSYSHAFYLITDQEELIRSLERLIEKNRASPQYQAARARWLSSDDRPQPDRQ